MTSVDGDLPRPLLVWLAARTPRPKREFAFFSFLRRPYTETSPRTRYLSAALPPSFPGLCPFLRTLSPLAFSVARLPFLSDSSANVRLKARVSVDIPRVTGRCPSATIVRPPRRCSSSRRHRRRRRSAKTKRNYFT